MKKLIYIALTIFISQNASANCAVYIPVKEFNVAGYPIRFDFTNMLSTKGYEEVEEADHANFQLNLEAVELPGTFVKAKTSMTLINTQNSIVAAASKTITCFTMSCAASDFSKSFNRSYQELSKKIPSCK